jgi:hypothetical protein
VRATAGLCQAGVGGRRRRLGTANRRRYPTGVDSAADGRSGSSTQFIAADPAGVTAGAKESSEAMYVGERSARVDLAGHRGLLVRGLVLVDDTLAGRLVQRAAGGALTLDDLVVVPGFEGFAEAADRGPEG